MRQKWTVVQSAKGFAAPIAMLQEKERLYRPETLGRTKSVTDQLSIIRHGIVMALTQVHHLGTGYSGVTSNKLKIIISASESLLTPRLLIFVHDGMPLI